MHSSEFVKNKMHFTIGLLAALFALHPFFPRLDEVHFSYMNFDIPLSSAFVCMGLLLASAVYFYATDLMNEQPSALSQRLGNYLYALAIMTIPFYLGMYASVLVENFLIQHQAWAEGAIQTPVITVGLLAFWLVVWQLSSFLFRRYLSKKDWISRIDQLVDREMDALKRAKDLTDQSHFDLAVIQFHKAVLTRLQMACMKRGVFRGRAIANAKKAGIINKTNKGWLDTILRHYAVAESPQPVEPGAAAETAEATKQLLATIPV